MSIRRLLFTIRLDGKFNPKAGILHIDQESLHSGWRRPAVIKPEHAEYQKIVRIVKDDVTVGVIRLNDNVDLSSIMYEKRVDDWPSFQRCFKSKFIKTAYLGTHLVVWYYAWKLALF